MIRSGLWPGSSWGSIPQTLEIMSRLSQVMTLQLSIWTMMLPPSPETNSLIKLEFVCGLRSCRRKGRYHGKLLAVLIGHTGPQRLIKWTHFLLGRALKTGEEWPWRGMAGCSDFSKYGSQSLFVYNYWTFPFVLNQYILGMSLYLQKYSVWFAF